MQPYVLQVHNLKTDFYTQDGMVTAVDGLSFDVAAGEMVGIVGESGCGKSTAALSLMRLLPPQGRIVGGQILLDGEDLVKLSERQMRTLRGPKIAIVFQDSLAALNPTMRIGQQIMEPLRLHLGMSDAQAHRRAVELLDLVRIPAAEARINSYPHEFSGGMRQRVMIAIALSCNPKLLIADEPTTALDVTVQKQILALLLELRQETGAGIILITHDVGVVAETCDRVIVMYAGREAEGGQTEAVFRSPKHPYTIGLLGSTLDLERDKSLPLDAIPGMPPDLLDLPPGCPFWPRCSWHTEKCKTETPRLQQHESEQFVACWHVDAVMRETAPREKVPREKVL